MSTLADLLSRARAKDPDATTELVRRFLPRVTALAHRLLQKRGGPQRIGALQVLSTGDVVQDVLIEVLRGLDRWDGDEEEPFAKLLATLVEHRLIDQIRREHADRRDVRRNSAAGPATLGAVAKQQGPATAAMNHEQFDIYREVLGTFDERQRALLSMRLEDGAEFSSLAGALAFPSADAARKAFHAVQARLLLRLRQRGLRIDGPGETRQP